MSTPEAVAWLRSQIEARLEAAKAAQAGPWTIETWEGMGGTWASVMVPFGPAAPNAKTGLTSMAKLGTQDAETATHIALNDPQDAIARCEAELAIVDFRALAETVAAAADDGETGERSEAQQAKRRLAVLDIAAGHLASGYRHREGYGKHWGSGD